MDSGSASSSPNRSSPTPSTPSFSRTTSSSSSESLTLSPPSKRCRYDEQPRIPSPVRSSPNIPTDRNPFREERRSVLYSPWQNPLADFVPEPRFFIPGEVKSPTDWLESLPEEENRMARFFVNKINVQHEASVTRHQHLVKQVQDLETDIRRLEADPKDWPKVGLDKISPMPMFLRDYCDSLRGKKD